jgi:hypothetical protein
VSLGGIGVGFERMATEQPWSGNMGERGVGTPTNAAGWPGSAARPVDLVGLKRAEFVALHGVDGLSDLGLR